MILSVTVVLGFVPSKPRASGDDPFYDVLEELPLG